MGGPTAHPTGGTLASGDPSNSLTARWGWSGSRPLGAAAPVFVLEAVCGRWRVLAGEGGVGGPCGQGSWTQNGLLLCRRSSEVVVDPSDGGEGGRTVVLRCSLGRGGEWEQKREEAVERLQRSERGQRPGRLQAEPRLCEQRFARWPL